MMKINKILLAVASLCLALAPSQAQTFEWSRSAMNGYRTGVKASTADNVTETLGEMRGRTYIAPNGRKFRKGATPKVAASLLSVQGEMAPVKTVIGHSAKEMVKEYPESELTNWAADAFIHFAEEKFGKKADVSIINYGGIRIDMPKGPILLDDILSMFPFNNTVCLVTLKGKDLRAIFDHMASAGFQCVSGVKIVAQDGKIVSILVGGEPLDDDKEYNVSTISFLLSGGDGYAIAKNAIAVLKTKEYIRDLMVPYVKSLEAEGKMVEAAKDGRVTILDHDGNPMPVVVL